MDAPEPLLSVVVTSRNDNHGGTLLRRMQTFTNGFIGQCKRHNLAAELIIVEWNPPADKPPLIEALKWPADLGPCAVRVVQVPPELHARMRHSAVLPLFQMIAKNVGIRRARGKFVLATNIDILFSDELVEFLASGRLEPRRMYRLDRHDVATDVPVDGSVEEQLAFCRNNLLRVNARVGTYRLTPDGRVSPEQNDIFGEGEFSFDRDWNPLDRWSPNGEPARWLRKESALTLRAPAGAPRPLRLTVSSGPSIGFRSFDLEVRDEGGAVVARSRVGCHAHRIDVTLPLKPGELGRFRFCVPLPVSRDPDGWERAFKLTSCAWAPEGPTESRPQPEGLNVADVPEFPERTIARDDSIMLGRGWVPLHYWQGEAVHWATQEATVVLRPRSGPPEPLQLLLESGPALRGRPFDLEVLDEGGKVAAAARVESMKPVLLNLPGSEQRSIYYRFRVPGPIQRDEDGVDRVFRLHSSGLGAAEVAAPAARQAEAPEFDPPVWYRAARRVVRLGRKVCRRLQRTHTAVARASESPSRTATAASASTATAEMAPVGEKPEGAAKPPVAEPKPAPAAHNLHTNACGDFTLMARSDWFALRGNPEWEIYSLHIDSMMCHAAHNAGVVETILSEPMRIYHIEHGIGSGWTPEGESSLMERVTRLGIPVLNWDQVYRWGAEMRQLNCTMIFNGPDWGLAREALPETVLSGAARTSSARAAA